MDIVRVKGRVPRHARPPADIPNLIEIQLNSYRWFKQDGLRELFRNFSPIEDFTGNLALSFCDPHDDEPKYYLGEPKYDILGCRDRDATFEAPLKARVWLENRRTGEIKESEVYLGELPIMTENGTFVVNGAERCVVSQLARSPGVYFRDTIDFSGRILYSAQVIPSEGAWLDIDSDAYYVVSVKIGQAHKFPVTTLLRALNSLNLAPDSEEIKCGTDKDLVRLFGKPEQASKLTAEALVDRRVWDRVVDPNTGEVIAEAGQLLEEEAATLIAELKPKGLLLAVIHPLIDETMERDPTHTEEEALLDIYRRERPGDPVTPEIARNRLSGLFADNRRYDLARVGRYKLNKKLGLDLPESVRTLTKDDLIAILRYLIRLGEADEAASVDEIDHLMNKRVRCVGELLQNQFRIGFLRMERICRERMTSLDPEQVTPQSIISTKPISAAIKSFFGSSQLSQFMDETNPLAELTHKRRLSALGPGGLSRQSAKLEVRDVHHSHYGRICPIETPEGPNIGLIGSMAIYARLDEYGFIETPYWRVKNEVVTEEIVYLTADEEDSYRIAPASVELDEKGRITPETVSVRYRDIYPQVTPKEIDFVDLSPKQIVSVATCLIPFLENDDANRALMGSNMQRQAVPLLQAEGPYVKTGVEARAAQDSGAVVLARADGMATSVTAKLIKITRADGTVDAYPLQKFVRSNQATCINQHPIVRTHDFVVKGQVLADGPGTEGGELALGRNVLVAFMPWEGFNYEDAIILGDRLVREDVFTSIHIEKYEIEARETKVGPEEITRDIPHGGEEALKDLDEDGVIRIGAQVRAEDVLVGKVAPKGQEELTSEEKLVRAIFGEKAAEMRDTSLRVPHGEKGKVVDIKRFSRLKYKCQKCETEYQVGKNQHRHYCDRCGGELKREPGDELLPGVNQLVRVYVAQKRKIMEGDKLAGRHGNKGVVAKILPEQDLPFLPDGTPVDIILNPLGVPSRMNIGQILETHLGLVAKELGIRFENPIFDGASDKEILEHFEVAAERFRKQALHKHVIDRLGLPEDIFDPEADWDSVKAAFTDWLSRTDPAELERVAEWAAVDSSEWEETRGAEARATYLADRIFERVDDMVGFSPKTGKSWLYDGRTGQRFNQPITIGQIYTMKLIHLVDDKIHARSTGPYSLVTQQPLGGKAQFGGQRFGEMEVWALEAYGAAHTLQEILTIKSDDVIGRVKAYESIVKGEPITDPGIPESFKILIKELQSLGLQLTVESKEAQPVSLDGQEVEEARP
ncbi:MAG: DNA-directed RNA polymerase subunit beta [Proteobacteria bacterium]|nr:DNA-directed RNA polymerase subunit beta [Pseudomonadota bacterium]